MQSYRDLIVYQRSYVNAIRIYEMAKGFPAEERYGFTSQIRRAAMSIPLNIAEGYGKAEIGKELLRYLSMARGSSAEMEVLLEFAKDIGYISGNEYAEMIDKQREVGRMLTGLMRSIEAKA